MIYRKFEGNSFARTRVCAGRADSRPSVRFTETQKKKKKKRQPETGWRAD